MSFSYLKNKFKKRGEGEEKQEDNREIIKLYELEEGEESEEKKEEKSTEEEELLKKLTARVYEIENDIPRIKVSIDTIKSQMKDLQEEIERLDKVIKDVMVLYEVVSQEINPFKDVDSKNPYLSELQELKEKVEDLRSEIAKIKSDLRLIVIDGIDLDELIFEVLEGGA
ncbi:MAG: archaeal flagellar protein FlaC [Thermococcaceae archaeon]|nr:archaeal flagellar protein FlaC [Thermococcaceae archaeon]